MYILLTIQISKESPSHLFLSAIAAIFLANVSKRFPSSGTFCWLLRMIASIHLLWNKIPLVIYSHSHFWTKIASGFVISTSQSSNWMISKKKKSLWAKSFMPTTWHSMYYHAPMPHHTQRNWQGRLIVISHTLISSEWTLITAHNHTFHHDVDLGPIPWKSSHSGGSSFSFSYNMVPGNIKLWLVSHENSTPDVARWSLHTQT